MPWGPQKNYCKKEHPCEFIQLPMLRWNNTGNNTRTYRNQRVRVCTMNAEMEVTPYSTEMLYGSWTMHQFLGCPVSGAAHMQTPMDALVVGLEHWGSFFTMPERKHHVNESLQKSLWLRGPGGLPCCTSMIFQGVRSITSHLLKNPTSIFSTQLQPIHSCLSHLNLLDLSPKFLLLTDSLIQPTLLFNASTFFLTP